MKSKIIKFINSLSPINILLVGLLGLVFTVHLFSIKRKKQENFKDISVPEKIYIDKYGDRHVLLNTIELNKKEINDLKKDKDVLVKKLDKLKSISKVQIKTDTFFNVVPIVDSNCNYYAKKQDSYITLEIKGNKDSAIFTYQSIDTLIYVDYVKFRLLKSNIRTVDIKNKNPYNKINAGKSFVLKESYTYLSAGPQIGYNPITQKLYYGIGIQFNVLPLIKK